MLALAPLAEGTFTGAIDSDGDYTLPDDFSGPITIGADVTERTIIGSGPENQHTDTYIVVEGDRENVLSLTIEDLNIQAPSGKSGIDFAACKDDGLVHELKLSGNSTITGGSNSAGIHVPDGVSLTIDSESDGILTAQGGTYSAGIGGKYSGKAGTITISGGDITAIGGTNGAGIGSGGGYNTLSTDGRKAAALCTITISAGTVTATGGDSGAGIGGSSKSSGGQITITGGNITATGGENGGGAGIGGGSLGAGGTVIIENDPTVIATATGAYAGADIGKGNGYSGSETGIIRRDDQDSGADLTYIRLEVQNLLSATGNKMMISEPGHEINSSGLTGFFVERTPGESTSIALFTEGELYPEISLTPGNVQNFRQTINGNVTIYYQAGSGGTVSKESEVVASITGTAQGATATANSGYLFVNWTKGEEVVSTVPSFVPPKTDGMNVAATYTANFKEKPELTITAASASKEYDGTALTNNGFSITGGVLAAGDSLTVTTTGSRTAVGIAANVISSVQVLHDNAEDVTENYDISCVAGILEVTARPLEITAASAAKKFDGTPLTDAGYSITAGSLAPGHSLVSVTVTGSRTDVGSSANSASGAVIQDTGGNNVTGNYDISYADGTLTVNKKSRSKDEAASQSAPSQPAPSQTTQDKVIVIVNDEEHDAGKERKTEEDGKSTVIIEVDNQAIADKIAEAVRNNPTGTGNAVIVPVADSEAEAAKVELTGDIVKELEENTFDVAVLRENVEYTIPAEEFTISQVAEKLGVAEKDLQDIKVEIKITKMDESVIANYQETVRARGAELVFPPVAFEITARTAKADGSEGEVAISHFSRYVERVIELPAGTDPSKITTGIVFNPDGSYSHVPTDVYQKDGKWYAKINSLTNSAYSVIWNPLTVISVENHWSKDTVNDLASRLIIFNRETFEPDRAISRADFAEYVVRALGLYRKGFVYVNKFTDVPNSGARTLAILIASEYGIVSGYPDQTFRPEQQITREEAMAMLQRAMGLTKLRGSDKDRYQNYRDFAEVSDWAKEAVKEALAARAFNGTGAVTISPKSNLTYAETAQAIKNLLVESKLINQ